MRDTRRPVGRRSDSVSFRVCSHAHQAAEKVVRRAWPRATEAPELLICRCGAAPCAAKKSFRSLSRMAAQEALRLRNDRNRLLTGEIHHGLEQHVRAIGAILPRSQLLR